jgi:ribA/ribD-fused uncharacterized protein
MLLDAQDMPRTADGLVPDVMVNPHCIPSRMTIAQLLEQVFGKLGAVIGAKMNATPFMNDQQSFNAIADALESIGIQREGEEILYSGITGKMFSSSVFMGPLYFMRIKHLVQDKLNARPTGRKEIRTHQPTGGRGNEGGMRIGEMERDSLIAHGVTNFLQESMMKRSDGAVFWICNGCGTIPIFNESHNLFVCPMCDGPLTYQGKTADTLGLVLPVKKSRATFSRVEMPYALKLLDQELTTYMNAGFRILTEKTVRQFQEPTEWNISEVLEATGKAELSEEAGMLEDKLDALAAGIPVAEIPPSADIGSEDAPEDAADEGAPSHNDLPAPPAVPEGAVVIEFHANNPQYKQFSNFYPVKLTLGGKIWPTVVHYFQAMKFPDSPEYQETVRVAKTPAQAKRLGKTMDVPMRPDWKEYRDEVMYTAIKEKFSDNHPELKAKLLETGNAVLRDGSPQDNYWGVGRKKLGQNKLGLILTRVRDEAKVAVPAPSVAMDALLTTEATAAASAAAAAAAVAAATPTVNVTVMAAPQGNPPILQISEVDASEVIPNVLEEGPKKVTWAGSPSHELPAPAITAPAITAPAIAPAPEPAPVTDALIPVAAPAIAVAPAVAPAVEPQQGGAVAPDPEYKTITISTPTK